MFKYKFDLKELTSFFNMVSSFNTESTFHTKDGVLSCTTMDITVTMMMWSNITPMEVIEESGMDIFTLNVDTMLNYLKSFKGTVDVELADGQVLLTSESRTASFRTLETRAIPPNTPPISDVVIFHLEEGEFKDYINSFAPHVKNFDAISFTTNTEGVSIEGFSEYNKADLKIQIPKSKVEKSLINQVAKFSIEFMLGLVKNIPSCRASLYFQKDFPLHIHATTADGTQNMRIWVAPRIGDEEYE